MEESTTYQAVTEKGVEKGTEKGIEQGALQEARKTLFLLREARFGVPTQAERAQIEAIEDLSALEQLTLRVLTATSWEDILGRPRRSGWRKKFP